jgi:hypothetical protein
MKHSTLIFLTIIVSLSCLSQDSLVVSKVFPFSDTTLSVVVLTDISSSENMVVVERNRNAIIYLSKDSIKSTLNRKLIESDFNRDDNKMILKELSRLETGKIQDLTKMYSSTMKSIISEQIMSGKARIYDRQNDVYLTALYHRIERVISTGYRTFYFSKTDRRYLFQYAAWYGIIPNELMPEIE